MPASHTLDVDSIAAVIGVIRVETVVRDGDDRHAVAVEVDAARSRPDA